jgi:signal transduction histidine kinase
MIARPLHIFARLSIALVAMFAMPAVAQRAAAPSAAVSYDGIVADAKAMMLVDPAQAIRRAKQAEQLADRLPQDRQMAARATAQWLQGEAYLRSNKIAQAKPLIERATRTLQAAGDRSKLMGDVLLSSGGVNTALADVTTALANYQSAHNIFRDIGETRSRAIALLSIAGLYIDAKDYRNALRYYEQAIQVYRGDPSLLLSIHNNRAGALTELKRYADADRQYQLALGLARTMNSPGLQAQILRNVARNHLMAGNVGAAEGAIESARRLTDSSDAESTAQLAAVGAQAQLQRGHLAQAEQLILRSFDGVDPTQTTLAYRPNHQTAFEIFRRLGKDQAALVHIEALKRLDDQTARLATTTGTALAAARFDFANQELRIAQLKADELQRNIDFERANAATRQNIAIGIALIVMVIVAMLAFGIVTLRRSRDQVRAANIDLAATNSALAKALAAKTEFLATTSHEIRTPLNGILGMTQVMLVDRTLSAALRDRINVVHAAGLTMRALVDDILDVAKIETGNLTIEQAPFDVTATLGEVAKLWQVQAEARGIGFVLDVAGSPGWIEGDAARLRQIVFNLLSNALKFTERGTVTLRARTSGDRLSIAVSDSGIGIPPEKHELIFESFRQVDAGTTRKFGGTGLGLAICRNLARAMDGDVRVQSASGEGATFVLDLPLIPAAPPEIAPIVDGQKALLILDRSPITRSMLRAVLEPGFGAVVFAGSPEDAVDKIEAGQIAQVLIDEATIRALDDRDAALAAIVEADLLASGISQVIAKPIAAPALIAKLAVSSNSRERGLVSRAA